jgi:hypothetical protein
MTPEPEHTFDELWEVITLLRNHKPENSGAVVEALEELYPGYGTEIAFDILCDEFAQHIERFKETIG